MPVTAARIAKFRSAGSSRGVCVRFISARRGYPLPGPRRRALPVSRPGSGREWRIRDVAASTVFLADRISSSKRDVAGRVPSVDLLLRAAVLASARHCKSHDQLYGQHVGVEQILVRPRSRGSISARGPRANVATTRKGTARGTASCTSVFLAPFGSHKRACMYIHNELSMVTKEHYPSNTKTPSISIDRDARLKPRQSTSGSYRSHHLFHIVVELT